MSSMIKFIPNLLTFANLSLGVLSILELMEENYLLSAIFILVAAFIDRYDGKLARRFKVCSAFGKELDSLADLITFGIAPALLIYYKYFYIHFEAFNIVGIIVLILYIICGASRLAKYNITEFNGSFVGLPITVAGFALSLYSLFVQSNLISAGIAVILMLAFSFLMVAKIKIAKK